MIPYSQIALMLSIGVATGICSGLFGIGGGIILVPTLVLLLGYSQITATGTSLVALLLPVGFLGVLEYYRAGKINAENIKFGLLLALGIFVGAYFGARIASGISPIVLRKSFAVFLMLVSLRMWFS